MLYYTLSILVVACFTQSVAAFGVICPSLNTCSSCSAVTLQGSSSSSSESSSPSSSSSSSTFATNTVIKGPPLPPLETTNKRLFLVRHGEVINPGGDRPVFYGAQDVSLSPLGEQEAQAAAAYLQQYELDALFCSPLKRAIYGAEQIAAVQDKVASVTILDGFTELERGAWRGRTKDEIGFDMLARFDACDESVTPEGGESFPQLKARVLEALATALKQLEPGQTGALVSHLQVTRSIVSEALAIPTEKMTQLPIATASVTCVDYAANDDDHHAPVEVHFQSFKPDVGLRQAKDGAN